MIKSAKELKREKLKIDLTAPQGNAFVLLGTAKKLANDLGLDLESILEEMCTSDYENLINTFDKYFGEVVDLYR